MDNAKSIYDKNTEPSGLTLRLDYMVEDFMELVQKEEKEKLVAEEN